jgi:hypothetical protein
MVKNKLFPKMNSELLAVIVLHLALTLAEAIEVVTTDRVVVHRLLHAL